jgi:hypothetical protein
MRFLVKARPDLQHTNEHLRNGSFEDRLRRVLAELKPEATYFLEEGGQRTAIMIVTMEQESDIPRIGEPFFLMGAQVFFHPVMTPEDLAKANIQELAKKWASE